MTKAKGRDEVSSSIAGPLGTAADLWQIQGQIERPAHSVPVVHDVDVAVVGAGVAGVIAAIAAGRHGAKTLMIEAFSSLGGNMGVGMFAGGSLHLALQHPAAFPNGLGGIPTEFNARVVGQEDRLVGADYFRDCQAVTYTATRMMEEEGVGILLNSVVSGAVKEADTVRGVFVETKSGTLAVRSRVVIDCTGTADVAARAGAPVIELPATRRPEPSSPSPEPTGRVTGRRWPRAARSPTRTTLGCRLTPRRQGISCPGRGRPGKRDSSASSTRWTTSPPSRSP